MDLGKERGLNVRPFYVKRLGEYAKCWQVLACVCMCVCVAEKWLIIQIMLCTLKTKIYSDCVSEAVLYNKGAQGRTRKVRCELNCHFLGSLWVRLVNLHGLLAPHLQNEGELSVIFKVIFIINTLSCKDTLRKINFISKQRLIHKDFLSAFSKQLFDHSSDDHY